MKKLRDYIDYRPAIPAPPPPPPAEEEEEEDRDLARISTIKAPAMNREWGSFEDTRSITERLRAMSTLALPVAGALQKRGHPYHRRHHSTPQPQQAHTPRDIMAWLVGLVATITSICATIYYYNAHEILLYSDALSHMRIARSVFDSATPGLAQLGDVWLPLPHILMWPFVWDNTLWQTGLAGSFVGMPCYVIAAIYLFLTARHLTQNSLLSFIGTWVFLFNPNILYLQVTPLSELLCIATFIVAGYYFLLWTETNHTRYLMYATMSTFLATLSRYDGWALFLALCLLTIVVSWLKAYPWKQTIAHLTLFVPIGGLGILLWVIWSAMIFGDPFYFQRGPFSAQNQQKSFMTRHELFTYHNLGESIRTYVLLSIETIGLLLFVLGVVAFLIFLVHSFLNFRKSKDRVNLAVALATLTFLAPYAFYAVSLYTGQAIIWTPGALPANAPSQFFNVRYGAQTVIPVALFVTVLISYLVRNLRKKHMIFTCYLFLAITIVLQSVLVSQSGIISLQDGISGTDCVHTLPTDVYLAQHYDGTRILVDTFNSNMNEAEDGIDLKNIIYDGSDVLWYQALHNPASLVDWVVANPGDLVSKQLDVQSPAFTQKFSLVVDAPGSYLYHRKGVPLPTRPIPPTIQVANTLCKG